MAEASLLARLEAVTSRLEGFASQLKGGGGGSGSGSGASSGGGDSKEVSEKVQQYDAYFSKDVAPFIEVAKKFKDTARIAELTERGFRGIRTYLDAAANCKRPSNAELEGFIKPLSSTIQDAEKNVDAKNQAFFPHMKAFAEGMSCLQWVLGTSPKGVIDGAFESADFYLIKILTAAKNQSGDEQKNNRDFVRLFKAMLTNLSTYAVANHKGGVDWNGRGSALKDYKPGSAGGAAAASAGPAPPAAPGAPAAPSAPSAPMDIPAAPTDLPSTDDSAAGGAAPGGMSAVFAAISAGSDKKSATEAFGLKKVDKSQMTHKNAALRDAPGLKPKEKAAEVKNQKTAEKDKKPAGPPRLALDKGTWFCENYEGKELTIPDVQMKQNVYIAKCKNITIQIPDKCKSISVDKCERVRVVFKAVVSTFEVVNSARIYASCLEACPSFALDKSNGVSVIISRAALDQIPAPPEIVSSCISECNVVVPGPTDDVDPIEIPIPEQFITKYDKTKKKLASEPVTHGG